MDRIYSGRLTSVFRVDVGGALTFRGGESELQFGQGSDSEVSRNTKFCNCICIDAEGRPDRKYPREIKSRKADLEKLRSGLWKEPLASAATLKVAEASPERPPVKACLNSGQEVGVYRTPSFLFVQPICHSGIRLLVMCIRKSIHLTMSGQLI